MIVFVEQPDLTPESGSIFTKIKQAMPSLSQLSAFVRTVSSPIVRISSNKRGGQSSRNNLAMSSNGHVDIEGGNKNDKHQKQHSCQQMEVRNREQKHYDQHQNQYQQHNRYCHSPTRKTHHNFNNNNKQKCVINLSTANQAVADYQHGFDPVLYSLDTLKYHTTKNRYQQDNQSMHPPIHAQTKTGDITTNKYNNNKYNKYEDYQYQENRQRRQLLRHRYYKILQIQQENAKKQHKLEHTARKHTSKPNDLISKAHNNKTAGKRRKIGMPQIEQELQENMDSTINIKSKLKMDMKDIGMLPYKKSIEQWKQQMKQLDKQILHLSVQQILRQNSNISQEYNREQHGYEDRQKQKIRLLLNKVNTFTNAQTQTQTQTDRVQQKQQQYIHGKQQERNINNTYNTNTNTNINNRSADNDNKVGITNKTQTSTVVYNKQHSAQHNNNNSNSNNNNNGINIQHSNNPFLKQNYKKINLQDIISGNYQNIFQAQTHKQQHRQQEADKSSIENKDKLSQHDRTNTNQPNSVLANKISYPIPTPTLTSPTSNTNSNPFIRSSPRTLDSSYPNNSQHSTTPPMTRPTPQSSQSPLIFSTIAFGNKDNSHHNQPNNIFNQLWKAKQPQFAPGQTPTPTMPIKYEPSFYPHQVSPTQQFPQYQSVQQNKAAALSMFFGSGDQSLFNESDRTAKKSRGGGPAKKSRGPARVS